jgi:hypothetical protein
MGGGLNETELAELRAAVAERIGDLLNEAPLPSDSAGLERTAVITSAPIRDVDAPFEVREAFAAALESRGDRDAATLLCACIAPASRARSSPA